jgi:hypothetical protein
MKDRVCLKCKGTGFVYNYQSLKYTAELCGCCTDGRVPFDSSDDGYGPLGFTQHLRTTEITYNNRVVGHTSDIAEARIDIQDATVRLNGIFTVRELEGIAALFQKIRSAGCKTNCECCRFFRND